MVDQSHGCMTRPFLLHGQEQIIAVEDWRQTVRRRSSVTGTIIDEVFCPTTSSGCAIQELSLSPSCAWLVTWRYSGQGEWGYDVFGTSPLRWEGGVREEYGYMLALPRFSSDETRLIGGFGEHWLGGWWAHEDDDALEPARGGLITIGCLFVHHLPSHLVQRYELQMDLPEGWIPDEPEAETWNGPQQIEPTDGGISLLLPGGVRVEINGPHDKVVLPTPHPAGGRLLTGTLSPS